LLAVKRYVSESLGVICICPALDTYPIPEITTVVAPDVSHLILVCSPRLIVAGSTKNEFMVGLLTVVPPPPESGVVACLHDMSMTQTATHKIIRFRMLLPLKDFNSIELSKLNLMSHAGENVTIM